MNFLYNNLPMLIFVFGIWACQNKVQVPKSESASKLSSLMISSVSYGTDPTAVKWYEYDHKGDLIRQAMSIDTVTFDYFKNKVVMRHLNKKLSWNAKTEYTTDNNGRVTSSILYDEKDKEISRFQYFYDEHGYLIRTQQQTVATGAQYINNYVYESGNLKEVKTYNAQGAEDSRYAYKYYLDQPDVLNLSLQQISDDMLCNERFGKTSKNMVSQFVNISKEGDTLSLVKYKYQMIKGDSMMRCAQSDVLNEFDTEVLYHFKKR